MGCSTGVKELEGASDDGDLDLDMYNVTLGRQRGGSDNLMASEVCHLDGWVQATVKGVIDGRVLVKERLG